MEAESVQVQYVPVKTDVEMSPGVPVAVVGMYPPQRIRQYIGEAGIGTLPYVPGVPYAVLLFGWFSLKK